MLLVRYCLGGLDLNTNEVPVEGLFESERMTYGEDVLHTRRSGGQVGDEY